MMSRAFRPIAAILAILLLSGAPTHAAPVAISQVIQVIGSYQNPPELRLRSVSQNTNSSVDENGGSSPVASAAQQSAAGGVGEIADSSTADVISADTLLSGVAVSADQQAGVDVVDSGRRGRHNLRLRRDNSSRWWFPEMAAAIPGCDTLLLHTRLR